MKHILILTISLYPVLCSNAQNWESVGIIDGSPRTLYTDTLEPAIYIGGSFMAFNGDTFGGIGKWTGDSLIPMGCGLDTKCLPWHNVAGGADVRSIVRYGNDIYATGSFSWADSLYCGGIARWDGDNWNPVGSGLRYSNGNEGIGMRLRVIDSVLYVCGIFDSIAGVAAKNLAKFDGTSWSAVHGFPGFGSSSTSDIGIVSDIALFQGDLYVSGNFYNYPENISRIIKWNDLDWVAVGNGLTGGGVFQIHVMQVWDTLLVVGGYFKMLQDEGNFVMGWNGNSWNTLGGGVNNTVFDLAVHDGYLYASGGFSKAGGYGYSQGATWDSIMGISRFDGYNWCSFETVFDNGVTNIEFFKDSLYVTGNFWSVNGNTSLTKLVKTKPGNLFPCSNTTSVGETVADIEQFLIYPNPASASVKIEINQEHSRSVAAIFDLTGRQVMKFRLEGPSTEINLSELTAGIYLIAIDGLQQRERLVKY